MPGPDIGDLYLDVHADTKGLAGEIRRAGKLAGKDFGSAFSGEASKGFGGLSADMVKQFNAGTYGQQSGKFFVDSFQKRAVKAMKGWNLDLDLDLQDAIRDADWGPVLDNFDSLQEAMDATEERLRVLSRGSSKQRSVLSQLGTSYGDVRASLDAYVQGMSDEAEASDKAEKALLRQKLAMQEMAKEITTGITASENLAKATEKQNQAFRDRSMRDWADQIGNGITASENLRKEQEKLAKSGRLKESILAMNDYGDAATDTRAAFRELSGELKKLQKADVGRRLGAQIRELAEEFDDLEGSFATMQRSQRDALVGMEKDQEGYARRVRESSEEVRGLSERLAGLAGRSSRLTTVVDLDTPSKGDAEKEGRSLGAAFSDAFRKALSRDKGRSGVFDSLKSEWNQFLYAFPAEVTLLLRYVGFIGVDLASLGSTIGATLTAAVSSLGGAVLGLGSAFAAVMPGIVYGVSLATASMKEFEESFPETAKAVQRLKDAFTEVDVPAFARQWEGSVRRFANTLAASLEGDTIAQNLGKAASSITDAFTGVLNSPGWRGFTTSMETTIPSALAAFGRGAANVAQVLLPFLSMAAELADALGARFEAWSATFLEVQTSAAGLESMRDLFTLWGESVDHTIDLIYNLWGALSATFRAGLPAGNEMLATLAALAQAWNDWSRSVEGQNALAVWFAQGVEVFDAIISLVGTLGSTLAEIVTPETVTALINFLAALEVVIPTLGELASILGDDLGVMQLFSAILIVINNALQPLLAPLSTLATILGDVLYGAILALSPVLEFLADIIGQLLTPLGQLVQGLGDFSSIASFVQTASAKIPQALVGIGDALTNLVDGLTAAAPAIVQGLGAVLTGLVQGIAVILPQLATAVGGLATTLVAELVAQAPALLTAAASLFGSIITALTNIMVQTGPAFWQGLGDLLLAISNSLPQFINAGMIAFSGLIDGIVQVIPQILTTIVTMVPQIISSLLSAIPQLFAAGQQIFTTIITALATIVPQILQAVITLIPQVVSTLVTMIPQIAQAAMQMWTSLVTAMLQILPQLVTQLLTMLPQLISALLSMIPSLVTAGLQAFQAVVTAVVQVIPMVIDTLTTLLPKIVNALVKMLPQLISTAVNLFTGIVSAVLKVLPQIINALLPLLPKLVAALLKMLPQLVQAAVTLFVGIVSAFAKALPQIISAVVGMLPQIISAISAMIPTLVTTALDLFLAIVTGLTQAIPEILSALAGLGGDILAALGDIDLSGIGSAIMNSLLDGLKEAWGGVTDFVGGIGSWIEEHKGPMSYDRVLLRPAGLAIMGGLEEGLHTGFRGVGREVESVGSKVTSTFAKTMGIASPSKVFRDFGKNLVESLALGMLENRDEVTKAIKSIGEDVVDLQEDLIDAEAKRIIEARKKANDRIRAANQSNGKDAKDRNYLPTISRTEAEKIARENTKNIRKVARDAYADLIAGQNRITKGVSTNEITNAAKKSQYSLNQFVKNEGVTLASLAQARKVMADRIEAQNERLQDAIKVRDDFAKQVRDAALDYASALSAAGSIQLGKGEVLTSDAVTDQMKKQLADLKTFRANIETLTARGLNQTTLQQIVEAGVEGGSALAQALVTGGKEAVTDTNSLQRQITTAAKGLGTDTSKTFYQAGVDSAKGLLEGLQSQNSKIKGAINKLAERLIKQFKKELGIRSPSKVLAVQIGGPMVAGIIQGLRAGAPDVSNTLRDISSGQVVVANRNPAPTAAQQAQGRSVVVEAGAIQVMPVTADPRLTANAVLDRLVARMQ